MAWLLPFFQWLWGGRGCWRDALPAHRSCSDIATSSPQTLICPRLSGLPWPASLRHLIKLFRHRPGRIRSPLPLQAPHDAGDGAGESAARRAPQPSSSAGCCPGAACPAARHGTRLGGGAGNWAPAAPLTPVPQTGTSTAAKTAGHHSRLSSGRRGRDRARSRTSNACMPPSCPRRCPATPPAGISP